MSDDLIPSAGVAAADVCLHIPGQPRPNEVLRHQRRCPGHTIVPSQGRVVVLLQDLQDEALGCGRNDQTAL